jgi:uncharacterized lipoprotein YddW (UPF0748 family)
MHQTTHRAAHALTFACAAALLLSGCYRRADLYGPAPHTPIAVPAEAEVEAVGAADDYGIAEAAPHGYHPSSLAVSLPVVPREFRGVWLATVGNMDWPSRRSLTTAQAQAELVRLFDTARDLGLNAVIFQVRPMADAFYASAIEPWSDYLTGASGKAPEPFWDPLAFAIEQAHARGLELHAWFNPFRAGFVAKQTPMAATHVTKTRPDLVRRYGSFFWLDPGEPDARRRAIDVITDVVRRYDVDGVHIDDYFYPYQERDARGRLIQFPDEASWREHGARTGLSRNDWRRSNIDTFVEQLYHAVRAEKSQVRVGISPFGIWRPGHPASVRGLDSYNELYADTRKWLIEGWADYYAPQLYWRTSAPQQPYVDLLQWWSEQNPFGRHIWAGNIPNNINDTPRGWHTSEIVEQVRLARAHHGVSGNVHFSASSLRRRAGTLHDEFRGNLYTEAALVPASAWLSTGAPRPFVYAEPDEGLHATRVSLRADGEHGSAWIVQAGWPGDEWQTMLLPGRTRDVHIDWRRGRAPEIVAVRFVDRAGVESEAVVLTLHSSR